MFEHFGFKFSVSGGKVQEAQQFWWNNERFEGSTMGLKEVCIHIHLHILYNIYIHTIIYIYIYIYIHTYTHKGSTGASFGSIRILAALRDRREVSVGSTNLRFYGVSPWFRV